MRFNTKQIKQIQALYTHLVDPKDIQDYFSIPKHQFIDVVYGHDKLDPFQVLKKVSTSIQFWVFTGGTPCPVYTDNQAKYISRILYSHGVPVYSIARFLDHDRMSVHAYVANLSRRRLGDLINLYQDN